MAGVPWAPGAWRRWLPSRRRSLPPSGRYERPKRPTTLRETLVSRYCLSCHRRQDPDPGRARELQTIGTRRRSATTVNRRRGKRSPASCGPDRCPRQAGRRPDEAAYKAALASLESALDGVAAAHPNPGPHRHVPAPEPHRVPQRGPRPAGAGGRRHRPAAGRLVELRLRQHHGGRSLADAARAVRLRGREDQPARGRAGRPGAGRRHGADPSGRDAGEAHRGVAGRHAGRGHRRAHVRRRRPLRGLGAPGARSQRACRGPERAPSVGAAAGRRADGAVHGGAASPTAKTRR